MGGLPNIRGGPLKGNPVVSFSSNPHHAMSGFTPMFAHLLPHQRSSSNLPSIVGWNLPVWCQTNPPQPSGICCGEGS